MTPAYRTWRILGAAVVCFLLLIAEAAAEVRVYYFHSTARCAECLQIEQMTGEILQENFPRELAGGQLAWHPTNADLPENSHFVFAYDLSANELVVVRDPADRTAWNKLPEVWTLAHDPGKFLTELVKMVRQALAKAD
ncbi:MAG TPA: nitrophenyl compound nitroreductase subunit ArsF family protein [Desulfuromonadales bacterium]|nr:nitrophenyl compound nitroreductase subunit ArsF family protein [Desulfuromonadales bacterium]